MTAKEALDLAIREYEKENLEDENNQWVKNVLDGLKKARQDLDRLRELEKKIIELKPVTIKKDDYISEQWDEDEEWRTYRCPSCKGSIKSYMHGFSYSYPKHCSCGKKIKWE